MKENDLVVIFLLNGAHRSLYIVDCGGASREDDGLSLASDVLEEWNRGDVSRANFIGGHAQCIQHVHAVFVPGARHEGDADLVCLGDETFPLRFAELVQLVEHLVLVRRSIVWVVPVFWRSPSDQVARFVGLEFDAVGTSAGCFFDHPLGCFNVAFVVCSALRDDVDGLAGADAVVGDLDCIHHYVRVLRGPAQTGFPVLRLPALWRSW